MVVDQFQRTNALIAFRSLPMGVMQRTLASTQIIFLVNFNRCFQFEFEVEKNAICAINCCSTSLNLTERNENAFRMPLWMSECNSFMHLCNVYFETKLIWLTSTEVCDESTPLYKIIFFIVRIRKLWDYPCCYFDIFLLSILYSFLRFLFCIAQLDYFRFKFKFKIRSFLLFDYNWLISFHHKINFFVIKKYRWFIILWNSWKNHQLNHNWL